MSASLMQGESLLAVDVAGANTRAGLFDVVDGEYRLLAMGSAPSTAEAPFKDVSQGVRDAISDLQSVTGRRLLDAERCLVTPSQPGGSGVDAFVATLSAGPALKTVVIGLQPDVSLESARRLAETTYARIVGSMGINDQRRPEQQVDRLIRLQPDLVLIAGGADGGASRSIRKMLEPVGLAGFLLEPEKRPAVLFAGNQKLDDEVQGLLGTVTSDMHISPNVRPSHDTEDLQPAARELAELFLKVRMRQLKGVDVLEAWSSEHILPTAYAEARMLRFLGQVYGVAQAGVLGIDVNVSAAVIAAAFAEKATLNVYPQFGLGENLPLLLQYTTLEDILRWSPIDVSTGVMRDYLFQKSLYPSTIAATKEDQILAQSVTRQALYLAVQAAKRDFPRSVMAARSGLLPYCERIFVGCGALGDAPTPAQALLLVLDAIQPTGTSTIILDRHNLLPLLGAASARSSVLPVQVLESGVFQSLGTVVSVVGLARSRTVICRASLTYDNGTEAQADVKFGNLESLPLPAGQSARLSLQPTRRANVGFGAGRGGTLTVRGGELGVVFDGRGRPLVLPTDAGRRCELLKTWLRSVGD